MPQFAKINWFQNENSRMDMIAKTAEKYYHSTIFYIYIVNICTYKCIVHVEHESISTYIFMSEYVSVYMGVCMCAVKYAINTIPYTVSTTVMNYGYAVLNYKYVYIVLCERSLTAKCF